MSMLKSPRTSLRPRGRRAQLWLEALEGRLLLAQDLLVGSFGNDRVLRYDGDTGAFVSIFAQGGGLSGPEGMVFGPDGNLYVSSFGSNNVKRFHGDTGAFMDTFTSGGTLDGPRSLTFGPDGNLYVVAFGNTQVKRYHGTTGAFLGDFTSGIALSSPAGLTFGPDGNLYVTSTSSQVRRYDGTTGAFLGDFTSGGGISRAWDVSFAPDGNLYVSDYSAENVKRYDGTTGAFLGVFAQGGGLSGTLGARFGPDGNLYVASSNTSQVKRYNGATGTFIDNFAQGGGLSSPFFLTFFPGTVTAGPVIINHTPLSVLETLSSIRVTFSRPINATTFTTADIINFFGALGEITPTSVTPVGTSGTQFDVNFPMQTIATSYVMEIGPDIQDTMGNPMDQDRDGIAGEFEDRYLAMFAIEGGRILSATRAAQPGVDRLRLTFNRAMRPDSFTDKWIYLQGPSGGIAITGAEAVAGSGGRQIDVLFAPQEELGTYYYTILPGIRDVWGNPSDQNGNRIGGEIPDDNFASSFEVAITRNVEDFESGNLSRYTVVDGPASAQVAAVAARDGAFGLRDFTGNDWIYRNDTDAQVQQGDTISVWFRSTAGATGRAYFAFGATATGTMSISMTTDTNEFRILYDPAYDFQVLATVQQTYLRDHWYRIEVAWGVGGNISARLYDSDGTTLLRTVTATHNVITSGGIGFRAFGSDWHWDTATVMPGGPAPFPGSGQFEGPHVDSALALALATSNRPEALLNLAGVDLASVIVPSSASAPLDPVHAVLSHDAILELVSSETVRPSSGELFALALTSL